MCIPPNFIPSAPVMEKRTMDKATILKSRAARRSPWLMAGAMLAYAILIGLMLITLPAKAPAHKAPSGWTYDTDCCGKNDCAPVTKAEFKDGKWWYSTQFGTKAVGPSTKFRESKDALTHVCIVAWSPDVYCLYNGAGN